MQNHSILFHWLNITQYFIIDLILPKTKVIPTQTAKKALSQCKILPEGSALKADNFTDANIISVKFLPVKRMWLSIFHYKNMELLLETNAKLSLLTNMKL